MSHTTAESEPDTGSRNQAPVNLAISSECRIQSPALRADIWVLHFDSCSRASEGSCSFHLPAQAGAGLPTSTAQHLPLVASQRRFTAPALYKCAPCLSRPFHLRRLFAAMQPQRCFQLPLLLLALLWLSLPDPPLNILPPDTSASAGKSRAAWHLLPGAHALVLSSSTLQSCVVDASTVRRCAWAVGIS